MKKIAAIMLLVVLGTGYGWAQNIKPYKHQGGDGGFAMSSDKYSKNLNMLIMRANSLGLDDKQVGELSAIQEKYVFPIIREESEFKISHLKIVKMLQDPDFDPKAVKEEMGASNKLHEKMTESYVDGLAAIRDVVGAQDFKRLRAMVKRSQHNMLQRRGDGKGKMQKQPSPEQWNKPDQNDKEVNK